MRKIVKRAVPIVIILAVVALFMVACDAYLNRLRAGWIVDKTFTKAHTERYVSYIYVGKVMMPQWRTIHYPDNWQFTIRNNGETATWDVYKSVYDKYEVGDWYDVDVEGTPTF